VTIRGYFCWKSDMNTCALKDLNVLVTTSPVPSNPAIKMISRVLGSLDRFLGEDYRLLLVCDGCEGGQEARQRYEEYKSRLRRLVSDGLHEVDKRVHQAGAVRRALGRVDTKFILLLEHDFEIVRPLETRRILHALDNHREVKFVRLNKRANRPTGWDRVLIAWEKVDELRLLRTPCWSSNPHFSRTEVYKELVVPCCRDGRSLEECLMGPPGNGRDDLNRLGFHEFQRKWGTFVYGGLGDLPVVNHLNGNTFLAKTA